MSLFDVDAAATGEIRAVGAGGTILRRDGGRWIHEASGTGATLRSIHAVASDEVWVAGEGGILLRRDGARWERVPAPGDADLRRVQVGADGAVWVADDAAIHRLADGRWERVLEVEYGDVWIDARGTVWALADQALLRWKGEAFEEVGRIDEAVWGGFRFGEGGEAPLILARNEILRWDGAAFEALVHLGPGAAIDAAADAGGVWVLSSYDDGLTGFRRLLHWDGAARSIAWEESYDPRSFHYPPWLRALVLRGGAPLLVGEAGRTLHRDGAAWVEPARSWASILDIVPIGEEIWAPTWGRSYSIGSVRWDGAWKRGPYHSAERWALAGSTPEDVWAIEFAYGGSAARLLRWRGSAWETEAEAFPYRALLAIDPWTAWAVGGGGAATRWDGTGWLEIDTGTQADLHLLQAHGPRDVWAAGDTIVRWDGKRWRTPPGIDPDAKLGIVSIAGSAPDDVWAVSRASVLHWDGARWEEVEGPGGHYEIWTAGGDAVFLSARAPSPDGPRLRWLRKGAAGWQALAWPPPASMAGTPARGFAHWGDALARFCRRL